MRTVPTRQGRRSRKYRSLLWCSVVLTSSVPDGSTARHASCSDRQPPQTSRGGYWTAPQSAQTCNSKRPSAAAAVRPSAARLRQSGGSVGWRVRATGSFLGGLARAGSCVAPRQDGRGGAQPAVVVDHAETAHHADAGVGHLVPPAVPVSWRSASVRPR